MKRSSGDSLQLKPYRMLKVILRVLFVLLMWPVVYFSPLLPPREPLVPLTVFLRQIVRFIKEG